MKILVTNDDGVFAPGLKTLVKSLGKFARVTVAAPDRERSAIGTAVTLRHPVRVQQVDSLAPGVETYSVNGTPGDSVILALAYLLNNDIDMVISGINQGANVGDDVLISGTVGAALQGYLHGFPAIAISVAAWENAYFDVAAELAAILAKRIKDNSLPSGIFLNVNVPSRPAPQIKGLAITRLAHISHTNTIKEENKDREGYYRLVRQKIDKPAKRNTDVWAIERDIISITPLHINLANKPPRLIMEKLCHGLFSEIGRH